MIIIDSKSIKNTYLAEEKGYDGGKKVSGIKLHIGVDTNGLPHAMCVTTANITDRDGAIEMLEMYAPNLKNVAKALCDGGYTGEDFAFAVKFLIDAEVEIAKRSELHKFAVIPKRWVVERTFSWLEHFRRLWKNCERLIHVSFQLTITSELNSSKFCGPKCFHIWDLGPQNLLLLFSAGVLSSLLLLCY